MIKEDEFDVTNYMKGANFTASQCEELIKGAIIRWDGKEPLNLRKILKWLSVDGLQMQ